MPLGPVVHIIDDDEAVRDSLAFLLETGDLVVQTHTSAERFLKELSDQPAGCIITDVNMPDMTGLELMTALNAVGASFPVVMITGHGDIPLAVEAMRAGVVDFIEKPFGDDVILEAVTKALTWGREQEKQAQERERIGKRVAGLSARERQVLDGLVAGQANKVVALELGISPRTVEVYRANLMAKMQASSLSELVRMALAVAPSN